MKLQYSETSILCADRNKKKISLQKLNLESDLNNGNYKKKHFEQVIVIKSTNSVKFSTKFSRIK